MHVFGKHVCCQCWNGLIAKLLVHFLIFRETRASKAALVDGYNSIEEGGLGASSSYSSDITEHENDEALDSLKDRVFFLKQVWILSFDVNYMSYVTWFAICYMVCHLFQSVIHTWFSHSNMYSCLINCYGWASPNKTFIYISRMLGVNKKSRWEIPLKCISRFSWMPWRLSTW